MHTAIDHALPDTRLRAFVRGYIERRQEGGRGQDCPPSHRFNQWIQCILAGIPRGAAQYTGSRIDTLPGRGGHLAGRSPLGVCSLCPLPIEPFPVPPTLGFPVLETLSETGPFFFLCSLDTVFLATGGSTGSPLWGAPRGASPGLASAENVGGLGSIARDIPFEAAAGSSRSLRIDIANMVAAISPARRMPAQIQGSAT